MIVSTGFKYCSDCQSGNRHANLAQIGQLVEARAERSWTQYTFYQCSKCGHVWQHIEDGGFGGKGSYWSLLTKP